VALLGASYEEGKDLYTLKELEERFNLNKLNKAPAVFDYKKLEWYNGQYIRMKSNEELALLALPYGIAAGLFGKTGTGEPDGEEGRIFTGAMGLVKERVSFLREIPEKLRYLFAEPPLPAAEEFVPKKSDLKQAVLLLRMGRDLVEPLAALSDEDAEALVKARAEREGVKLGDLMMPLRVAVTGARISPPLFGSLRLLGPQRSLERTERALAFLEGKQALPQI
jgi:glutamyl-tRNA synthetase